MSEPTPSVPVVRLPSRRVVAGVVLLLAGLLAAGGTFGSIYNLTVLVSLGLSSFDHTFAVTSWTTEFPSYGLPFGETSRANYFGVPVIVAAVLAIYAANLLLRGRDPLHRLVRIRLFAVAATALIAGYIWFAVTNLIDSIDTNAGSTTFTYGPGPGMWLLIAAGLVGALGCVLLLGLVPGAAAAQLPPADEAIVYQVDVDTPPMGFEVPVNLPPTDTYQPPEKPEQR
ncbi:hypothetical protein [Kutzneria kofuensis]|uniref:Uncharacterized protein n=1 Tax=Kutzneria kofuensis TaxID=103725 RepID=A0A7W9KHM1_9PSEU|nr:hypothetical protein [Kutzneria kofuensis]MBB5892772.1 hypothetical protein [Kutzneria kofuensis]